MTCFLVGCEENDRDGEGSGNESEILSQDDSSKGETKVEFLNEAKDWENQTVTILTYNGEFSYHSIQIDTEGKNGYQINDAVFERNKLIEEQYGIKIQAIMPFYDELPDKMILEDISSCLNRYNAYCIPITQLAPLALNGILQDFNEVDGEYLHLDQAWWDQSLMEDIAVNDHIYFLAGDALIEDDESTWAIYFNKNLIKKHKLEDPYQLVRDGKWTLDKMYELAQRVDKSTGSKKTYNKALVSGGDQWGIVAQSYDFYQLMLGCQQRIIDNTKARPVIRITDKQNVETFNTLTNLFYDTRNCGIADDYGRWDEGIYQTEKEIFVVGNALFMPNSISIVGSHLRDANFDYGILPMPKRNEKQKQYSSSVSVYHYSVLAMPKSCRDMDMTCYALEAMAYYGRQIVTPEYYDYLLTLRQYEDKDENSAEMLDYIFANRTYDMASVYNFGQDNDNGLLYFYTNMIGSKNTDIESAYKRNKSYYESELKRFVETAYR